MFASPASSSPQVATNSEPRVTATPSGIDVSRNGQRALLAFDPQSGLPPKFVVLRADRRLCRTSELWLTKAEVEKVLELAKSVCPSDESGVLFVRSLSGGDDARVDPEVVNELYEAADAKRHAIETLKGRGGTPAAYTRHVGYGSSEAIMTVRFDGGPSTCSPLHNGPQRVLTDEEISTHFPTEELAAQTEKEAGQAFAKLRGEVIPLAEQDVSSRVQANPVNGAGVAFGPRS